ncbi:Transmembrane amino acid transporter protein [Tritrichomonas foetus]|uniref:Transmembrane amino acid transporter protein n=1 Tax=Tritrichomonas foetus TaxID=1144522 RepID=A0A1J4JXF3_9EUKA|nr:Transmembrane amino acid transporter protein [Tritrichomonas foetus]|eukprot:OHT01957.1 Transmembrane amino acid transporter protein [Tritrichomonas foetus]
MKDCTNEPDIELEFIEIQEGADVDYEGNPIQKPMIESNSESEATNKTTESTSEVGKKEITLHRVRRFPTFVNLINALVGAGIVGVPATFKHSGLGPTIFLLILSCFLCYMCSNIIINLQYELKIKGLDELAFVCFKKPGEIIISILCMIFSLSCTVSYLIIGAAKIADWCTLGNFDVSGTWSYRILTLVYALVFPVALTIPRHLSFLSKFSYVSLVSIGFYAIAILIKSIIELSKPNSLPESVIGYNINSGIFSAFSVHALTFSLSIVMMPVIAPYNPIPRKRHFILGVTYLFSWFVVAIPGAFAYLTKGSDTASDMLSSYPKDDILIIVVQAFMLCNVSISYPVVIQSLVGSLGQLIFKQNLPELMTLKQRLILIPIIDAVNIIIAMFLTDIQPVLGIGGSLGGCIVVFTFPSACRLRITKDKLYTPRNIGHIILVIFGLAFACVCTYYTVLDAIKAYS